VSYDMGVSADPVSLRSGSHPALDLEVSLPILDCTHFLPKERPSPSSNFLLSVESVEGRGLGRRQGAGGPRRAR